MAEKNALVAEKKQTENRLRNTEADLGAVKNQKNIAEQRSPPPPLLFLPLSYPLNPIPSPFIKK